MGWKMQGGDLQFNFKAEGEMSAGARELERRKNLAKTRKLASLGAKISQVQQYWSTLNPETKRGFLRIRISDLKEHLRSIENDLATAVLSDALEILQENDSWKFMECCVCDQKFTDPLLFVEHFANEHLEGLPKTLRALVPQEMDADWVDMIEKGGWKPEDVSTVLQVREDRLKSKSSSDVQFTLMDMDVVYTQNSTKDPFVEEIKKRHDKVLMEAEISNPKDEKCGNQEPEGSEGPLSDYPRRAKTLERIQAMLQMLLKGRYLSRRHVLQVIQYIMEELQLRNLRLDKSLQGLCLLEFHQLEKVLKFLHLVAYNCGITEFPEPNDALARTQKSQTGQRIYFSIDSLYLLLDERLLSGELGVSTSNNSTSNEASKLSCSIDDQAHIDALPGPGLFIPWIFAGCSIEENLAWWASLIDYRGYRKPKAFDNLKKEFYLLKDFCSAKMSHSANEIYNKNDGESNRKAQESYTCLLNEQKEELNVMGADDTTLHGQLSDLLEEAQYMRKEIRRCELLTSLQLCLTDARIIHILANMQQEGYMVGEISASAYRSILVMSVKSFIRAQLEDLVDKYAREKASAAEEELLADLALEAKKSVDSGDGKRKGKQKKSKKKGIVKSKDLEL